MSEAASVESAAEQILREAGRVDILVNNAGITKDGLLMRMSEADWDAVLDINLKGTFLFTKAFSRPLLKQKSGRIVNIASVIGLIGNAGQCNYAASKAGVIGLTKSCAREFASRGITVNAIAPGFIQTAMTDKLHRSAKTRLSGRFRWPAWARLRTWRRRCCFSPARRRVMSPGRFWRWTAGW